MEKDKIEIKFSLTKKQAEFLQNIIDSEYQKLRKRDMTDDDKKKVEEIEEAFQQQVSKELGEGKITSMQAVKTSLDFVNRLMHDFGQCGSCSDMITEIMEQIVVQTVNLDFDEKGSH